MGNTAKEIVNLVNDKFDSTGVSATATTTVKLEGLTDSAGSHVVSFNLYGKNTTAQTISATITLGATTGAADLTGLRDSLMLILLILVLEQRLVRMLQILF